MKILHISVNPDFFSGGLIIHVKALMKKQIENGHRVFYFSGGGRTILPLAYVKNCSDTEVTGLQVFKLQNSPNRPYYQRGRPLEEIENPTIDLYFEKLLKKIEPDIVHFHELQGLSASCIDVAKKHNIPTIFTFHGYWPLCSEVLLFDYLGKNCSDYFEGYKCVPCNYSDRNYYFKLFLTTKFPIFPNLYNSIKRKTKNVTVKSKQIGFDKSKVDPSTAKKYRDRRVGFVKKLNGCDLLISLSNRMKEIYSYCGVDPGKIKVINNPIFLKKSIVTEIKNIRKEARDIRGKINFCYNGGIVPHKGVNVLIRSFSKIPVEKADLYLYGKGDKDYIDELKKVAGKNVFFMPPYRHEDLAGILRKTDIGIIPSICEEAFCTAGLEFLAAGIPVIGSRIGGITDYLKNNVNGLLFEPGNEDELLAALSKIIENENLIVRLKENIDPAIKTLDELYSEMDSIYRRMLNSTARN